MFLKNKSARPFSSETEIDNQLTVFTFFPFLRNFHYDFHSEKHRSKKFFVIKRLKTEIYFIITHQLFSNPLFLCMQSEHWIGD